MNGELSFSNYDLILAVSKNPENLIVSPQTPALSRCSFKYFFIPSGASELYSQHPSREHSLKGNRDCSPVGPTKDRRHELARALPLQS